jgi:hypothetical protein
MWRAIKIEIMGKKKAGKIQKNDKDSMSDIEWEAEREDLSRFLKGGLAAK